MTAQGLDIKPEQFKDVFTTPVSFQEAWGHPDPFQ